MWIICDKKVKAVKGVQGQTLERNYNTKLVKSGDAMRDRERDSEAFMKESGVGEAVSEISPRD